MTILYLAFDVVREAAARRHLAVVFGLVALAQVALALALDLDVVGGAIVASKLFGSTVGQASGSAVQASEQLRPVFRALIGVIYYLGILFGVVATADVAVKALSPGRVELLLGLPVRRWELALGIFLGVTTIALAGTLFAVGGFSLVLFWKAGFATLAPLWGALMAVLGFMVVYSAMLLATTFARSAALASGVGIGLVLLSVIVDDREEVRSWFTAGWGRELVGWLIAPVPQLRTLGRLGRALAGGAVEGEVFDAGLLLGTSVAAVAFALACVLAAMWRLERRDW